MLELKNLYSGYNGKDVIYDISLNISAGEIMAIIGPNGCGKTTFLKTLARLLPYRGSIMLNDNDITHFSRKNLAKKIALLAQSSGIYFPYTVYDTASLGRYPHTQSFLKDLGPEDKEIVRLLLERLDLWDIKDRLINELSGGQLQRVFLARALIQEPDLILLDEPTNHLDLKHQLELLKFLSVWVKEKKRAVIAVLHDLNLARSFAGTTALMCQGHLVSVGRTDQVLSGPALKEVYEIDIQGFMRESLGKWA